jgi:hypothetical protein
MRPIFRIASEPLYFFYGSWRRESTPASRDRLRLRLLTERRGTMGPGPTLSRRGAASYHQFSFLVCEQV